MDKDTLMATAATLGLIVIPDMDVEAFAKGGVSVFKGRLSDFPPAILANGAAYAIHKKCQDASGGSDITTEAQAKEAANAVVASLKAGTWAKRGGGARATTWEAWIDRQATNRAKVLVGPKGAHAGKDEAKVKAALLAKEAWVAQQRAVWDAKGADTDLDV